MATDRQTIMETNRSLRTIKNELENLLEKGVIDDDIYETIHASLPAEAPLRGGARANQNATPSSSSNPTSPPAPTQAMSNLNLQNQNQHQHQHQDQQRSNPSPAPPSYTQSTGQAAPPPGPPPAPSKPILAHARALYRYHASDARDLSFERDDKIQVHEYMNADWWMGRNTRTGAEGIFPKTYVAVDSTEPTPPPAPPARSPQPGYGQQQQPGYGSLPPQQQLWPPPGGEKSQYAPPGPPPPQQHNPYNSSVPPMAVANQGSSTQPPPPPQQGQEGQPQQQEDSAGMKIGKKLGNATIFGAGATLGGNLVNSIF